MGGHGVVAPQGDQGALFDLPIPGEIAVDKEALIGVPAPDPLVPLDPVQEEGPGAEHEGVGRHGEDLVQFLILKVQKIKNKKKVESCI